MPKQWILLGTVGFSPRREDVNRTVKKFSTILLLHTTTKKKKKTHLPPKNRFHSKVRRDLNHTRFERITFRSGVERATVALFIISYNYSGWSATLSSLPSGPNELSYPKVLILAHVSPAELPNKKRDIIFSLNEVYCSFGDIHHVIKACVAYRFRC
jgi:hypothetical protein